MIITLDSGHVDLMIDVARTELTELTDSDRAAAIEAAIERCAEHGYTPDEMPEKVGVVQSLIEIGYLLAMSDIRSSVTVL